MIPRPDWMQRWWRQLLSSPRVKSLRTDARLLRMYGTRSPERIRLANSPNHIFLDPTDQRARTIIRGLGRGLQPRLRRIWHEAVTRLHPTIVLDVGVNYGEFLFAETYPSDVRLIGVEANTRLKHWISRSVASHPNNGQIEMIYALASNADNQQKPFYVASDWSGASSAVLHSQRKNVDEVSVPTISIDSLLGGRDLEADTLLFKIDTEGYEPVVMSGMRDTISRCKNLFGIVEFDTQLLTSLEIDLEQFVRDLFARFTIHLLDPNGHLAKLDAPSVQRLRELLGVENVVCDMLLSSSITLFEQLQIGSLVR